MADSYEIANVEDADEWDRFVRGALGGSVFSSSAWLACASGAVGGAVHTVGCYKNGHLIAAISGQDGAGGGIKRFTTPVLTPHGGLLLAPIPAKTPGPMIAIKSSAQISELIERVATMISSATGRTNITEGVVLRAAMKATGTAIKRAAIVPSVAMLMVSQIGHHKFEI